VRTMATIAAYAEDSLPEDVVPANETPRFDRPTGALASAAVEIASHLKATAIIAATEHGHTATLVSKSRPHQPIIAVTHHPETYTQLPLLWGVTPVLVSQDGSVDEMLDRAVRMAVKLKLVENGDLVVIIALTTQPVGVVTRASNVLRIAHVLQRM